MPKDNKKWNIGGLPADDPDEAIAAIEEQINGNKLPRPKELVRKAKAEKERKRQRRIEEKKATVIVHLKQAARDGRSQITEEVFRELHSDIVHWLVAAGYQCEIDKQNNHTVHLKIRWES